MSKENTIDHYQGIPLEETNPTPDNIVRLIQLSELRVPLGETIGVVVEDENCEVRNIDYAWFDRTRNMVRLTLRKTKFEDCEEV